jgi:phthiodiolone/phenolphthiodiolone dimycocerosates ketoreductase
MFGEKLKLLHASGAVDYVHVWDQMMGWWPRHLWTPENSPLAHFVGDIDSQPEAFTLGAYALATVPEIGLSISTDAIRRGPTEVLQALLTLENLSGHGGRAPVLQLGAGEVRNIKPYGYKRSEGLNRLEDHLRFYHAYRTTDRPIDLEGNNWKYNQAWLGRGGNADNLRLWGLGGGPKLLDITTSYADGISSLTPGVWSRPEQTSEQVTAVKQMLARKERDPEAFDFALWGAALVHEDEDAIERALINPIVRWLAAIVGRFNQGDWLSEGSEPPIGADWHYGTKFLPLAYDSDRACGAGDPGPDDSRRGPQVVPVRHPRTGRRPAPRTRRSRRDVGRGRRHDAVRARARASGDGGASQHPGVSDRRGSNGGRRHDSRDRTGRVIRGAMKRRARADTGRAGRSPTGNAARSASDTAFGYADA